ncbi:Mitochondrial inner membrane protein oxa1l [Rhizophlyctis rosea]|uniref:Mitochondrial inner membrane protein oxa1l n=1 Tax=Rhizophlyctis rosea TaxID=64517 RepID=A0AAD5SH68_9FUNG|nr:Mitochondrial inner membrane protein oxa1l [Rhizophlyctis rosea]
MAVLSRSLSAAVSIARLGSARFHTQHVHTTRLLRGGSVTSFAGNTNRLRHPVSSVLASRSYFWSSKKEVIETAPPAASPVPTPQASAAPTTTNTTPFAPQTPITETVTSVADAAPTPKSTFLADASVTDLSLPKLEAVTQIGDLKHLGLENNTPVGLVERLLEAIYVTTGLPWWATIIAATVIMRAALFPLILKGNRAVTIIHNVKPLTDPINASMKRAKANGDKMGQQQYTMKLWDIYKQHKVSPLQPMWALAQMPVFISFFLALRKMGDVHVPGMEDGGFAWFTNLSVADPTLALPVAASGLMLMNMESGADSQTQLQSNAIRWVMRAGIGFSLWFTYQLPAVVFLYWITTNIISFIQQRALKNQTVRGWLGLPMKDGRVADMAMKATSKIPIRRAYNMVNEAKAESKKRAAKAVMDATRATVSAAAKA